MEPEALYAELGRWLRWSPVDTIDSPRLAPPPTAALGAGPPGFDAAHAQRWMDQAPDEWRRMARVFVAEYREAATAVAAALDVGDRARAHDLLHRLRGAAGALGAKELTEAAGRLELALAGDGPIDADLRGRFFASAEAAWAFLAGLEAPALGQAAPSAAAEPACAESSRRLRELEALLEAGNTRALEHLPWLERCGGPEAPGEGGKLLRQIEALDVPAALETLRSLEKGVLANPR